jgi:hypothetical protein
MSSASQASEPETVTSAPSPVNFDGTPICEVTLDDTDYRFDSGKQGTAVSISTRPTGSWDWTFRGEARWDGSAFRTKAFERSVLLPLSAAFKRALAEIES